MQSSLPDLDYSVLAAGLMEADSMTRQASIENETDENKKDLKKVAETLAIKGHHEECHRLEDIITSM